MTKIIMLVALAVLLAGCENLYQDDGMPRIRTQRDVEAYNATVSSESEKLVCTREFVIGTNIRQFLCLTVAQQERMAEHAREELDIVGSTIGAQTGGDF